MKEHTGANQTKHSETEQKNRLRQAEAEPAFDQFYTGEDVASFGTSLQMMRNQHNESPDATAPGTLTPSKVLHLQQTHGNRYVQRLLQSRKVQAKLTVNPADDIYEMEADRVARRIANTSSFPYPQEQNDEALQLKAIVGKQEVSDEETENVPDISGDMEARIEAARNGGQPLNTSTRELVETDLGYDLSKVRVHTNAEADTISQQLGAEAFTMGKDIFFRKGAYQPQSGIGKMLIAHELTHVVQQNASESPGSDMVLQLFRSGRAGSASYEENPEDTITISMPYQIRHFDTILNTIDEVIQSGFGSSGRTYTADGGFQSGLRSYLESIGHPSVSGGGSGGGAEALTFRIRLVRGAGDRILTIQFITSHAAERTDEETESEAYTSEWSFEEMNAPEEPTAERPPEEINSAEEESPEYAAPTAERTSEATGAEESTSGWTLEELMAIEGEAPGTPAEEETIGIATSAEVETPATTTQPRELSAFQRACAAVSEGLETAGDYISARWLWEPILEGIAGWEGQLSSIGDQWQGQPVLGRFLLPTISVLFVVLQAIVGTLDMLARLNPYNIAARWVSAEVRVASGVTTPEQLLEELSPLGHEGLNLLTLGVMTAVDHLRQAYREGNAFRWIQGISEIIMAVLALVGIRSGISALRARLRGGAPGVAVTEARVATPEATPVEPIESARTQAVEVTPSEPVAEAVQSATTAESIETARTGAVEAVPAEPVETARTGVAEAVLAEPIESARTGVAETPRPVEPGEAARQVAPIEPIESLEGVRRFEPVTEVEPGGPRIEYVIEDQATALQLRDQVMRGERPGRVTPCSREWMQGEWESMGGQGEAPLAWWQENGALRLDWERSGWASPEVQRVEAGRIAENAQRRTSSQRQAIESGDTGVAEAQAPVEPIAEAVPAESIETARTGAVEAVPAEPIESARTGVAETPRPVEPGEAARQVAPIEPIESLEGVRRFEPVTEVEPGGPRIEYVIEDQATALQLRDQVMRGERPGRVTPCSREWMQGEWESMGGQGEAPLAWWQENGALRLDWERSGWASPEVQRVEAGRIAERAQAAEAESIRRQLASPANRIGEARPAEGPQALSPAEIGIRMELADVESARGVLQLFRERGGAVYGRSARGMQQVWEQYGGEGEAPVAFVDGNGRLVINMEAVNVPAGVQ